MRRQTTIVRPSLELLSSIKRDVKKERWGMRLRRAWRTLYFVGGLLGWLWLVFEVWRHLKR